MRKRLLILALALFAMLPTAWAYDFSATSPSGHTLYYEIISGTNVGVVKPGIGSTYDNYVTGNVVIPATVVYNSTTYNVTELRSVYSSSYGGYYYGSFESCSGLTSVTIPNSVTSIGIQAFYGCSGLTSVTIPNSVTSIGHGAFSGCSGLTSVTIPNSVTSIGSYAFSLVKNIIYNGTATGSPWGALSVNGYIEGDFVYANNTKTSLLAYIGTSTSVTIPNSVTSIGNKAFSYCSGLTSVTIPNSVTTIGENAFLYCSGLTSVTIPNSVTTIESYAFQNCSGLTTLNFNAINCGDFSSYHRFRNCPITTINIGNSVQRIPGYFAYGLDSLRVVTIPASVTSIGESAFRGCSGLTSVTIPNSVTSIGIQAFYGCSGLTSVTIPNSVTSIGIQAFYGCSGLTSVTIPNSVTSIGHGAFSGCSGLTSVAIPNGVTSIESGTFSGCTSLTSVTIPNSVTTIGNLNRSIYGGAFYNCTSLTSVTIPNSVTSIGYEDFYNCTSLTSVTIGNSVTSIGTYAFYNCSGLTSVTIPNSVTTIGDAAFSGCSGLTTLNFNATNYSSSFYDGEYYQFYNCPISTINIGDNVQQIPASFAPNLNSLSTITIPNSVTHIGAYAFRNCTGLASIIMGDSVDYIGEYVFDNTAYYINDANWEDDLLYINNWLIAAKQSSPGEYVIKDNTRGIASGAFSSCSTIRSIKSKSEVPPMGSSWGIPTTTTINVSCQALSAYLTHSDWSAFTNIQAVPYDVELLVNNPTMGSVGFISNTCSSTMFQAFPNSDYIFQSWSDGNTQNPRILINLANDTTITANFAAEGTTTPDSDTIVIYDTVVVHDTIGLTIHDTLYLPIYDTVYITDTTRSHDTIYLPQYIHDTTYIVDTLLLTDTIYLPQYIHDTVYIHDTIYITGIENVATINAKIYSSHSRIVVEGANGNNVMLFDMNGRLLATKQDEYRVLEFDVPISGAYFVKIGNYKAKKVVVIK